jgi:predicted kinase
MTVILTVGIPASGKTTWARQHVKEHGNTMIVSRDDIREAMGVASGEAEQAVTLVHRAQMEGAFAAGMDVIVADTNINPKFRKALIKFCHEHAQDVHVKVFPIGLDEAILRDSKRIDKVGADVVTKFWNDMQSQSLRDDTLPHPRFKKYEHVLGADWKPPAVIVDIDGTVANHDGKRSPFDESKVFGDQPIWDVIDIIGSLKASGDYSIVFVSGRTDGCEDDTRQWIEFFFQFDKTEYDLFMRKSGDQRPDYVIKAEIYDEKVIPNWNIKMVFDDRDQVVRHVRARGITVAQVAPGRF